MSWVKLDDGYPEHQKLLTLRDLAPLAGWLNIAAICYCSRNLTDGFIPVGVVPRLSSFPSRIKALDLARLLVQVELWEPATDGFMVHDYLVYNPSRAEVEKKREAWASRQQNSRESRVESRRDMTRDSHRDSTPRPPVVDSLSPVPHSRIDSASHEAHFARDGLPNLTPDAIAVLEHVTGMTAYQAGDKQLAEYDRLVGTHGLEKVTDALDAIRSNTTMTARQLVWAAVKYLEPIPDAKHVAAVDREQANIEAGRRRVLATIRAGHASGSHTDTPHPRCPDCHTGGKAA